MLRYEESGVNRYRGLPGGKDRLSELDIDQQDVNKTCTSLSLGFGDGPEWFLMSGMF